LVKNMKPRQTPKGYDVLHNPKLNKSTAFSEEERERLGLRGLLPACLCNQETQQQRVMENLRRKAFDIERYIFLNALQERNERLFYRTVIDNIEEIMPLIYTPTVGQACKEFAHIFRTAKGFYITPKDRGDIRKILDNWPEHNVRVIVVTDGERILGLGDLGANGMGIPIGKLALYVACAGIQPHQCLPVMLDVGTNNEVLLNDPLYLGRRERRITGPAYLDLVEEFMTAIKDKFPRVLVQFEDFLTPNAYRLLRRYRDKALCFNDDIQGTAAVALAGVYAAIRISGNTFADLRIMFLGAGSAATGIADLMVLALQKKGLSQTDAAQRLWFVDRKGLVVADRDELMKHNLPYAHKHKAMNFPDAIKQLRPHVLIGATGAAGAFTQEVIELMTSINERPIIFALSNPTSKAECTAEQAYAWSQGKAIFTSGSPFAPVYYRGKLIRPSQGNNAYIFPGVGLGAIISNTSFINDSMFLASAQALADMVSVQDLDAGALYPSLTNIREVSLNIAEAVARQAYAATLTQECEPDNLRQHIAAQMYDPTY